MIAFERTPLGAISERSMHQGVRARDGVRLATDVYLVDGATDPRPVILTRTPYDITSDVGYFPEIAEYFNRAGYHFVAQDVRGKYRSEGESVIFVNEVNDGYDTIEWITQQSWSDGSIVMWGDSYYGYTQWAAASSKHPALRAISPRITGLGLGEHPDLSRDGNTRDVFQSILLSYTTSLFHDNFGYEWRPEFTKRPYVQEYLDFQDEIGKPSPSFQLYFPHHLPVRRFPEGHPFDRPAIPTLITTGWWDNCAMWVWRDYWNLQARATWKQALHLVIDPVDHNYNFFGQAPTSGEARAAVLDDFLPIYLDPSLEFFDYYLGRAEVQEPLPAARWNLVGTEGYRHSDEWPPKGARQYEFFPTESGVLSSVRGEVAVVSWTHDPDDLVPAPVRDQFSFLAEATSEHAISEREDVIAFTSARFNEATDLVGRVFFRATVSTSGPSMDLIVRLYDVKPDGELQRISGGQVHIIDASGEQQVMIELDPVGYRLFAGHAVRLHVASSEFPSFIPQPGTTESEWEAVDVVPTTQRLTVGGTNTMLTIGRKPQ